MQNSNDSEMYLNMKVLDIRKPTKLKLIFKKTSNKFAGVSYPHFSGVEYIHLPINENFYFVDVMTTLTGSQIEAEFLHPNETGGNDEYLFL
jgi:hypothetical protein